MIRGYAPHIWENKLESDKRRDTALLLAAELDDRKVAVVRRLRCALSRLLLESEQVRAVPNPQSSAKRDIAAPSKYGLCLRRRAKKSRSRLFFFARQPALPYGNTAAADFRAICIRIRSPRQSGTSQRRASMDCAFSTEQKRAARGSFSLRGSPPHTRRNTSSAETSSAPSPAGEGKGFLLFSCSVQSFGCFSGFEGIVFPQSNQAFPSGGRGTACGG